MDYRSSGVDIARAERALSRIGELVRRTHGAEVLPLRAGFAGAYRPSGGERVLLATIDGVGTKLKLATEVGRVGGIGHDIVNHCANDVLVHGGRPLFFLDYVGTGVLDEDRFVEILEGMSAACARVGCALIGGETAEMPGIYHGDDLDLVGTMIGEVEAGLIVDGSDVEPGDVVLGLASDGLHTNGFSLARRVVEERGGGYRSPVPGGAGESWSEALLVPHRAYGRAVLPLVEAKLVRAMAHVTGGGIPQNLARVLPAGTGARIDASRWARAPLFGALVELGEIHPDEAFRTFNMGIGFLLVVRASVAREVAGALASAEERVFELGEIVGGRGVSIEGPGSDASG